MNKPVIQFEHISKIYEDNGAVALTDFSAQIEEGEFVLLTGASGSGKTTLMRLLMKETSPTQGRIYVQQRELATLKDEEVPYYRRGIGVVFQSQLLVPNLTAYQNVELARIATGGRKKETKKVIAALFSMLGISQLHKRYPREMSGGQVKRVCLARALVNHPKILLADEPTGNLHPEASVELMQLFEVIHRQGITVVVATHDLESAKGLPYREIKLP